MSLVLAPRGIGQNPNGSTSSSLSILYYADMQIFTHSLGP